MPAAKGEDFGINVRVKRVAKASSSGAAAGNEGNEGNEGNSESSPFEFPADRFFNCLACGYVHDAAAMRRSSGVCHACGTMVRRAAVELLEGPEAIEPSDDAERRANDLRDTLVRFDEESSARTTVIDDQGEYYDLVKANAWLDEEEVREEVARERAERRGGRVRELGVDLLGRRFVEFVDDGVGGDDDDDDDDVQGVDGRHLEVSERERPWGGGRGVDGVGRAGRAGRAGRKNGPSTEFLSFLEDRGEGFFSVGGGLRFVPPP